MLDSIFHEWFEGRWSNQRQAYENPRGQSFVHILHEFDGVSFDCTYRYARQKSPYRYFSASLHNDDGHVLLKNPIHDLRFKVQHGCFTTSDSFISNGIRYVNEAYLGATWYHVKDQGFDVKTGKQLWGLEGDEFYEFLRC